MKNKLACRLPLFALITAFIVAIISPSIIYAAPSSEELSNINALKSAVQHCVKNELKDSFSSSNAKQGEIFKTNLFGFEVGSWVESQVGDQGGIIDGKIYCDENDSNLLRTYARYVGTDFETLLCGKDGKGGIVKPILGVVGKNCKDLLNDSSRYFEPASGASNHIDQLFSDWANSNNVSSEQIAESNASPYQEALKKFKDRCTAGTGNIVYSDTPGNTFNPKVKIVDSSGNISEKYLKYPKAWTDKEYPPNKPLTEVHAFDIANCSDIIKDINAEVEAHKDEIAAAGGTNTFGGSPSDASSEEGEGEKTCMTESGAVGWVICPVINAASSASSWLYNNFIEDALNTKAALFKNEDTYKSWQIFQGFANVVFAIFLLVVIFSQLSGVGINNYGIKKILPKLVVAVVLINLSYIICQACVDVSNIVGSGIKGIFDQLSTGALPSSENNAEQATALIGGISLGGLAVSSVLIAEGGIGLLIALAGVAISAVVAIFMLFIILAVRQAAVILLVVISPLAFVCYMLPNTKKLFDRWQKVLTAMLVLYPLCGLVVGGSAFASRLILQVSGDSIMLQLTAVLMSVVPFFTIPSLARSSIAGLGAAGGKLSGMAQKASGLASKRATTGMRNTQRFKDYQKGRQEGKALKNARRIHNKYGHLTPEQIADLSVGKRNQLASATKVLEAQATQPASIAAAQSKLQRLQSNQGQANLQQQFENQEFDEAIKAQEAQYVNDSQEELQAKFEEALKTSDPNNINDQYNIRALHNQLISRFSSKGVDSANKAIAAAQRSGANTGNLNTVASNMTNKWNKEYKGYSNTALDWAKDQNAGKNRATDEARTAAVQANGGAALDYNSPAHAGLTAGSLDHQAVNYKNLTQERMLSASDSELDRIVSDINSLPAGYLTTASTLADPEARAAEDARKAQMRATVDMINQMTLSNTQAGGSGGVKMENIAKYQQIVNDARARGGYQAKVTPQTVRIDHSGGGGGGTGGAGGGGTT